MSRRARPSIEAKQHLRKIDVKNVEAFIGVIRDIDVERGIMLSSNGYTPAAAQRVFADDVDIDLDIFSLAEFTGWQSAGGLPYAGNNGAVLDAPLGWVLEPRPHPQVLAVLYRRGLDLLTAQREWEYMYVNIWDRGNGSSLEDLLAKQARDLEGWDRATAISVRFPDLRESQRTCIRRAETVNYPVAEITGFVEFDDFILFVVMFSPLVHERRNVRKLEYVLRTLIPFKMIRPNLNGRGDR